MVLTRTADTKALKLQRQGRMGTYAPSLGHEACQVGSAFGPVPGRTGSSPTSGTWGFTSRWAIPWPTTTIIWMGNEAGLQHARRPQHLPPRHSRRLPDPPGRGARAWPLNIRKLGAAVVCHVRRRRDLRRRFPRGPELRRRLQDAQRLRLLQQPVGDLRAAVAPDRRRDASPRRPLAYGFPGVQVDGNDVLAVLRGRRARPRTRPGAAAARPSSKPTPTGWATTRPRTTRRSTGRRRTSRSGRSATRPAASRLYLAAQRALGRGLRKERPGHGRGQRRKGRRRSRSRAAGHGRGHLRLHLRRRCRRTSPNELAELKAR